MKRYYIFMTALVALSLLVVGLQVITGRAPASDQKIVDDFSQINTAVNIYATTNHKLPARLTDIKAEDGLKERLKNYQYRITARDTYELCAVFQTDSSSKYGSSVPDPTPSEHGRGRQCFSNTSYAIPVDNAPIIYDYNPKPPTAAQPTTGLMVCNQSVSDLHSDADLTLVSVDSNHSALTAKTGSNTAVQSFLLPANGLSIYNQSCNSLSMADLKTNDKITVYTQTGSNTAKVIEKFN